MRECYTNYTMNEIENADSFARLDIQWQQLLQTATSNHVFFTPQWQSAWWQVFGSGYELVLLSMYDYRELVGIAPFKCKDGKLSFIGNSDVCDYMDFVSKAGGEDYFFSRLLDYLDKLEWSSLELDSILPQSLALKYFIPLAGIIFARNKNAYQYLPDTASKFPFGEKLVDMLNSTGLFSNVEAYPQTFGVVYIFIATVN